MRRPFAIVAVLALPLAACDSGTPAPKACSLNVTAEAAAAPVAYSYIVSRTGMATVTTISYRSAAPTAGTSGITTERPVTLPWTAEVTLPVGIAPLLSVTGTVTEGTLAAVAEGRAVGSAAVVVNASDACSQNASD